MTTNLISTVTWFAIIDVERLKDTGIRTGNPGVASRTANRMSVKYQRKFVAKPLGEVVEFLAERESVTPTER